MAAPASESAQPAGHATPLRGFAEPAHADSPAILELHRRLGLLEKLRPICTATDIGIPGVVVVGEQSSGKSSLLESISGIQFPRAQNICTRVPCVLTLLSDPTLTSPVVYIGASPSPQDDDRCQLNEVADKIRDLTEKRTLAGPFISKEAIYIKVVRKSGPQLSLIDLPGLAHNANQMENIHEVTESLVQEYIRKEEMVILCVVPALSDFGNAEAIKLAQRFDPSGQRTLGVVTKCDDAARVEASDLIDKVLMRRASDIRLPMGFHCVVNRSQKDIDERTHFDAAWAKENTVFSQSTKFASLPREQWGTLRLMEKIAGIQAHRMDERFPLIREEVRLKLEEARKEQRELPVPLETEQECLREFNAVLRLVLDDLQARVRAEFVSSAQEDRAMAIAPRVADMEERFRDGLRQGSPNWLGQEKIDEVLDAVKTYAHGYSVENLMGPQVFVGFIRRTFVEGGLLRNAAEDLISGIASHLQCVTSHIIRARCIGHAALAAALINRATEVIEACAQKVRLLCFDLADAQQVTSTTHAAYTSKLAKFRRCWLERAGVKSSWAARQPAPMEMDADCQPTPEFMNLVKAAQMEPLKAPVLETCASLHIYSGFLIDTFADMAAKLVRFNMVEKLSSSLEDTWRSSLGCQGLHSLFPADSAAAARRSELQQRVEKLQTIREQLASCFEPCDPRSSSLASAAAGGTQERQEKKARLNR